jgi:Methyltransferase small domain
MTGLVEAWMHALFERHARPLGTPAFLRAVRALSVRYVERRAELADRSPIDSAGKRAAFAGFFAPMHFLTARAIIELTQQNAAPLSTIVDLGCGTGVAGAAWALALPGRPSVVGIDQHPWALDEAKWNWRALGIDGRVRRGDLVRSCVQLRQRFHRSARGTGIVLGWAVNELSADERRTLLPALLDIAGAGASVLVIEPIARRAAPWWDEWAATFGEARGVAREWPAAITLMPPFDELDRAAGFRRESLSARSLSIRG